MKLSIATALAVLAFSSNSALAQNFDVDIPGILIARGDGLYERDEGLYARDEDYHERLLARAYKHGYHEGVRLAARPAAARPATNHPAAADNGSNSPGLGGGQGLKVPHDAHRPKPRPGFSAASGGRGGLVNSGTQQCSDLYTCTSSSDCTVWGDSVGLSCHTCRSDGRCAP